MSTAEQARAHEWDCSSDEYHAATEYVGHFALEVFRKSPRLYHAQFVTQKMKNPEPSEAMLLGQWLHAAVLAPWEFEELVQGKLLAPEKRRLELTCSLKGAIERHPQASALLSLDGPCEKAILWADSETGLMCKCKPDKVAKLPDGRPVIPDLKSALDPSPEAFSKQAFNLGYHRGVAHYKQGYHELTGEEAAYVHIVVGKKPPHEVAIYELDEDAIVLGHRQNRVLLDRLADCKKTGLWAAEHEKQITRLSLPRFAFTQNEDWEV